MESTEEAVMKKGKRPKSPTRILNRMPTYVVAFAVHETFDDSQKLQLITTKGSAENSTSNINSISPTDSINSTKTLTITPTTKLSSVIDIATVSEVKIDIIYENQSRDVIKKKSPQISSYIVIDNRMADEQPRIVFNALKHIKRYKDSNKFPRKKPRKNKHVIAFKNIHFKHKKPKNCITRRLSQNYYEKFKLNAPNSERIQKQIYSSILSNVSRSQVLKKVLAKENLLADSDRISPNDSISIFEYDDTSLNSSPSITKQSFTSFTSQKTLIHNDSSLSRNEDFNCIKTASSTFRVTSETQITYKSEIINEALAVALDTPKTNKEQSAATINEKLMHKDNLTSSETLLQNNTTKLTSKSSSSEETNQLINQPRNYIINYDDLSPTNLNEKVKSNATITQDVKFVAGVYSDEDTFVIARTSSDFDRPSINSDYTFNSETKLHTENVQSSSSKNNEFSNDNSEKISLVDKVKNLGYYPTQIPSIGYSANFSSEMNDVLVTDNIINSLPLTSKNISSDLPTDTKKKYILRKPIDVKNMNYLQNNISLPIDLTIKAKLKEVDEDKRSCADNVRNTYPTDLGEMWERLTFVLDLALKRLEETLADRILKDIRASLTVFNQPWNKGPTVEVQRAETTAAPVNYERPIPIMLHKEIFVSEEHLKRDVDIFVQCDLVHKQVIDQLMLKLSVEAPKPIPSSVALKVLQPPEIVKDYVEILKPRVAQAIDSASVEVGKGDTVTVSTATTDLSTVSGFSRFKLLFSGPLAFLRENMVVLTSVPTFFILMFCIYGVIVIIMKPW